MHSKKALILVDLQNDFCEGGSLAVAGGSEVVGVANQLQSTFELVVATQDWHSSQHKSFAVNHAGRAVGEVIALNELSQVLWPAHCVQGSEGAAFHPDLGTQAIKKIIQKGVDDHIDSYSAFYDNAHLRSTGLGDYLKQEQITDVYIMGLATDYCVKFSVLDALHLGFNVFVIEDGCRGVELAVGDVDRAMQEMQAAGAVLVSSRDLTASE